LALGALDLEFPGGIAGQIRPEKPRKALLQWSSLPKETVQPAGKGGEIELKFLKAIMILAVLAGALSLGACAQHKESSTMTSSAGTTGYAK
jgi:hypothetical protein